MKTSEILTSARATIADESRWTTEYLAVNAAGVEVEPTDDTACRWCAVGALDTVGTRGAAAWRRAYD